MNPDVVQCTPAAFDEGRLASGDGHLAWYAQYGNPDGIPLFWLHGGPGSGSSVRHIGLIDLARYRLVLSDQRGCGRSLPAGTTERNETGLLVGDIDRLRVHLRLDRIVLGGGSWGAALALAYAAAHRPGVAALMLRAPFLASAAEMDAFFAPPPGVAQDYWEEFAALAPACERHSLLPWLAGQLASGNREQCARIAIAWCRYEAQRASGGEAAPAVPKTQDALMARYRIQAHYLRHGCFLGAGGVLTAARSLRGLPVAIVHGDADIVCPPHNARLLQRSLPASRLRMVAGAGHDPFHPGMASALAQALACYARSGHFDDWEMAHA